MKQILFCISVVLTFIGITNSSSQTLPDNKIGIIVESANLSIDPDPFSKTLVTLDKDDVVNIIKQVDDEWLKVEHNEIIGFIFAEFVQKRTFKEFAKNQKNKEEETNKQTEIETQVAEEQAKSQAVSLFAQYIRPIRNKVEKSWIRPGSLRPGTRAKVLVRVSPQGDVLTARIQAGSGDPIFDRSVINAVYQASPLPIPDDPRLYPHYRDFVFNFDSPG